MSRARRCPARHDQAVWRRPGEPQGIECPARRTSLEAASAADLLVVGARRRRGHPGLQQGLINHALLHHAPRPVAVVPQI
nr:universal stress protein [Streptomyces canus]